LCCTFWVHHCCAWFAIGGNAAISSINAGVFGDAGFIFGDLIAGGGFLLQLLREFASAGVSHEVDAGVVATSACSDSLVRH
jgi:hypothetical protein